MALLYEIVAYEHEKWGSALEELEKLGLEMSLRHLKALANFAQRATPLTLDPHFYNYRGIRFYKSELKRTVVAYSVEKRVEKRTGNTELKLTVMFAGKLGVRFECGPPSRRAVWNGSDLKELFEGVVYERAKTWFY